ncbi:MAG: DsbE family thiol:disulfide interchange protein [Formivibrio sp.]|nr:DsbE family thiol:disulfide interchange protein [Formivibrio sp.]
MKRFLIPLVLFLVLAVFLAIGLNRDPHEVPSPLIGKPAPAFKLMTLAEGKPFAPADLHGKVWILNVWASWCVSCREEHPLLVAFARQSHLPIVGLNYKEVRGDGELDVKNISAADEEKLVRQRANQWLTERGNPYSLVVLDMDGRVSIDYGVYGVPESYVIDKSGVIRYKQIGPFTPEVLQEKVLPLVEQLEKQS